MCVKDVNYVIETYVVIVSMTGVQSNKEVTGTLGWGCSSVGRASDRHTADTGSIPR